MTKPTVKIEDINLGTISIDKNNGKGPRGGINYKAQLEYLCHAKEEYEAILEVALEIEAAKKTQETSLKEDSQITDIKEPEKKGFFARLFGK